MNKKRLVVLSGAGMSAESGISTFRDSNGLWENHDITEVASPIGFAKDPKMVLNFYNLRRAQLKEVEPNQGHKLLAELEGTYQVDIVTQNVDDLHERAGSSSVLHLHGELRKVRSTKNPSMIYDWEEDLNLGDLGDDGAQLRPHIVWFGEAVPMLETAIPIVQQADILLVIGTSLQVYPAAGLVGLAPESAKRYLIDPNPVPWSSNELVHIQDGASEGMKTFISQL